LIGLAWLSFLGASLCFTVAAWQLVELRSGRLQLTQRLQAAPSVSGVVRRELAGHLARSRLVSRIGRRLTAGGLEISPTTFLFRCSLGLLLLFVAVRVLGSVWLALFMVLFGGIAINLWLDRRVQQRLERLVGQLPDLARLLSNAANAGLALKTGIELAAREMAEPIRSELVLVNESLAVGYSLEEALSAMARRLPSREVSVLITTLLVQQRSGGKIITALHNIAATLETRKEVRREVRTAIAGAISSVYLVVGIGIGSLFFLNLISPGAFDRMMGSGVGLLVIIFSVSMYAIGFVIVRRMTKIEL
jgi:tight adherence protein B